MTPAPTLKDASPNVGASADDALDTSGSTSRPRSVALLAAVAALMVLIPGCAAAAKAAGAVVLSIGTDVVVQAGADYVRQVLSSDDAKGDPTVVVSYTNAAGDGVGTNYAVDRADKITTQSVTIKDATGDVHIVVAGNGLAVTVASGATASIEIQLTGNGRGGQAASTAKDQAATIDGIIRWSGRSREALFAALADLGACRNIVGATAALQKVADDRAHQIDALGKVDVSALPDGGSLRGTLLRALNFSREADLAFVRWGNAQQSGCRKDDNHSKAMSYSRSATAAKSQFLVAWKSVARTYGLPEYQETDI